MKFLEQNFECSGCGRCCRGWNIHVDPKCYRAVQGSPLEDAIRAETGEAGMRLNPTGAISTAMRAEQSCTYLGPSNRCRIHENLGGRAKPLTCQQFPFLMTRCPDGLVVSASFYCPSIQQDYGPPLSSYAADLEELLKLQSVPTVGDEVRVAGDFSISYEEYLDIERYLLEQLEADNFGIAVAQLLSVLVLPDEGGRRWREELAKVDSAHLTDPILLYLYQLNTIGMIDRAEISYGAMVAQAQAEEPLDFKSLNYKVLLNDIYAYNSRAATPWLRDHQVRYMKALIFRKFLALPPGLLENLLAASLLPAVIGTYTVASAMARGAECPQPADFFVGVDHCEKDLVTHGIESQALTGSYLRFLRERWQKIRAAQ